MSTDIQRHTQIVVLSAVLTLGFASLAEAQTKVAVVNEPSVTVAEPVPHTQFEKYEGISVSGGQKVQHNVKLETDGFSSAIVSIAAETQGSAGPTGMVTATLIPDVPFVVRALDRGVELFPIWVGVSVSGDDQSIFGSQPMKFPLAFPRYRVIFFNTSDRPVKAYLYVNLTN